MSGSGISWAVCKSAPRSRQITTPASHHSVFYRPDVLPAAQPTASKHYQAIRRGQIWAGQSMTPKLPLLTANSGFSPSTRPVGYKSITGQLDWLSHVSIHLTSVTDRHTNRPRYDDNARSHLMPRFAAYRHIKLVNVTPKSSLALCLNDNFEQGIAPGATRRYAP